jgi:hypothetical protein
MHGSDMTSELSQRMSSAGTLAYLKLNHVRLEDADDAISLSSNTLCQIPCHGEVGTSRDHVAHVTTVRASIENAPVDSSFNQSCEIFRGVTHEFLWQRLQSADVIHRKLQMASCIAHRINAGSVSLNLMCFSHFFGRICPGIGLSTSEAALNQMAQWNLVLDEESKPSWAQFNPQLNIISLISDLHITGNYVFIVCDEIRHVDFLPALMVCSIGSNCPVVHTASSNCA